VPSGLDANWRMSLRRGRSQGSMRTIRSPFGHRRAFEVPRRRSGDGEALLPHPAASALNRPSPIAA
jgi:hypothetical protein